MKIWKLFISSTFIDFKEERDALQQKLFPYLETLCKEKGYEFSPIDLRWGVNDQSAYNQKTMDICLNQVYKSCDKPYPGFLLFLGNRYGWMPLPKKINKKVFETILKYCKENSEKQKLKKWYKFDKNELDENANGAYLLKPRKKEYKKWENWEKVEKTIHQIFKKINDSIISSGNGRDFRICNDFFTDVSKSATRHEFDKYKEAWKNDKKNQMFFVNRTSNKINSTNDDEINQDLLKKFKEEVLEVATDNNIIEISDTKEKYIDNIIDDLKIYYTEIIKKFKPDHEHRNQKKYLNSLCEKSRILKEQDSQYILDFINEESSKTLVLHGEAGSGKSYLMAQIIHKVKLNEKSQKMKIFYKFVSISQQSMTLEQILISILTIDFKMDVSKFENLSFDILIEEFAKEIGKIKSSKIVIFLDGVNQLIGKPYNLIEVLIEKLLETKINIKIIISVIKEEYEFKKIPFTTYQISYIEKNDAKKLLKEELKKHGRKLQSNQVEYILDLYKNVKTPLYLKVVAEEAKLYHSNAKPHKEPVVLADTQIDAIKEYIENLNKFFHHDKELVKRFFCLIYLTKSSLSINLIYQILSRDKTLNKRLCKNSDCQLENKIPYVIYARLLDHVDEFLRENSNGHLFFIHKQFEEAIDSLYTKNLPNLQEIFLDYLYDMFKEDENSTENFALALVYLITFDKESSMQNLEKFIKRFNNKKELLQKIGDNFYQINSYEEAIFTYKSLQTNDISKDIALKMVLCFFNLNQQKEIISHIKDNIISFVGDKNSSIDEKNFFKNGLDKILDNGEEYIKICDLFFEMHNINKSSKHPLEIVTQVYTQLGLLDNAKQGAVEALKSLPVTDNVKLPKIEYSLGKIYMLKDNPDEAKYWLSKAKEKAMENESHEDNKSIIKACKDLLKLLV